MKLVLIAVLALAAPTLALAEEPTGFAEFPWGTPRADLWQPCTTPAKTMPQILPNVKPMTLPSYPPTIFTREAGVSEMTCGGRTLELPSGGWNPRLLFVHDRLAGYQFTPRSAYSALRRIAVEKFGEPTATSVARYTMKTGATITGEVLTWRWPSGGVAQLSERFTKIDDSLLMVYTAAYTEATGRRNEEAIEKAKKSF